MEIQVREHGRHVVVLTVDNQPRLNAMSRQMMADLARLWDELDRGDCRCVVLTGAGTRAFCAGADMSGDLSAAPETARVVSHALLKHHVFSKPIVAAVNGDCVGGGVELLLSTITLAGGSSTVLHGAVHLVVFGAFLVVEIVP